MEICNKHGEVIHGWFRDRFDDGPCPWCMLEKTKSECVTLKDQNIILSDLKNEYGEALLKDCSEETLCPIKVENSSLSQQLAIIKEHVKLLEERLDIYVEIGREMREELEEINDITKRKDNERGI